jgi:hypothetical protein
MSGQVALTIIPALTPWMVYLPPSADFLVTDFCLNLFPHPQPLSHVWERGDIILVPLLPCLGEGVRG